MGIVVHQDNDAYDDLHNCDFFFAVGEYCVIREDINETNSKKIPFNSFAYSRFQMDSFCGLSSSSTECL